MLLPLDDAYDIIARKISPVTQTEKCALLSASHRISAEEVLAPYALPPFTNTGVDGYAFQYRNDITFLTLVGASYAGEPYTGKLQEGQAARIATGAVLPEGADTVVMQEDCMVENGKVFINHLPQKGSNIRHAGGDIAKGECAIPKVQRILPQDIALLSALRIKELNVLRPLKIGIASTGMELAGPEDKASVGRIVDTNTQMLSQMLGSSSIQVSVLPPIADDYDETRKALYAASDDFDLVLTTGGVSVGDRDFVRDVLQTEGGIHFWKLAIRPGKPVMLGSIGRCLMLGLPGNPVSAYVTCLLVARAVIQALSGVTPALPEGFDVELGEDVLKLEQLRAFPRAEYSNGIAIPCPEQGSNLYTSLTRAHGLLDLPVGRTSFSKGEKVMFRPFSSFV